MPPRAVFSWTGKEYTFEQRSADWYWALGIGAVAIIIVCIIFSDILFGIVVFFAAIAVGLAAAKHPQLHRYALTDSGLIIDDRLHHYDTMISYSVIDYIDESLPPSLSIKTDTYLHPHILVPLPPEDSEMIYTYLLQHVPHHPHKITLVDHLMALFRF